MLLKLIKFTKINEIMALATKLLNLGSSCCKIIFGVLVLNAFFYGISAVNIFVKYSSNLASFANLMKTRGLGCSDMHERSLDNSSQK